MPEKGAEVVFFPLIVAVTNPDATSWPFSIAMPVMVGTASMVVGRLAPNVSAVPKPNRRAMAVSKLNPRALPGNNELNADLLLFITLSYLLLNQNLRLKRGAVFLKRSTFAPQMSKTRGG